jgi:hypothetical protein
MFGFWGLGGGIVLLLFGIFCVFFFPSSSYHQEQNITVGGIVIGVVSLIIGGALIFL